MQWMLRHGHLDLSAPRFMGIVNVTPDSFSDGGKYLDPTLALRHASLLVDLGADLLDIGAESTRPGAESVSPEKEWQRLEPVLRLLKENISIPISVDTRHSEVARKALGFGVGIINDISGGRDPALLEAVAESGAGLVLMHLRGSHESRMDRFFYHDLVSEVGEELLYCRDRALALGVSPNKICLDPGFGFSKTPDQNWQLLSNLSQLVSLGHPLLIGVSRKRFLREKVGSDLIALDKASAAVAWQAFEQGAHIFRVHEVQVTRDLMRRFELLRSFKECS